MIITASSNSKASNVLTPPSFGVALTFFQNIDVALLEIYLISSRRAIDMRNNFEFDAPRKHVEAKSTAFRQLAALTRPNGLQRGVNLHQHIVRQITIRLDHAARNRHGTHQRRHHQVRQRGLVAHRASLWQHLLHA